ncbi:MAG: hypothetical protein GY759_02120 [Chloroflexi bacterium]|nr:hypothetical protein [Chloroflexota bacterium]
MDEAIAELVSAAHQDDRQAMLARLQVLIPECQTVGEPVVGLGRGAEPPSELEMSAASVAPIRPVFQG